jgi:hypothetical protein
MALSLQAADELAKEGISVEVSRIVFCLLLKLLFGIEIFGSWTGHMLLIGRHSIYLHLIFDSFPKMV